MSRNLEETKSKFSVFISRLSQQRKQVPVLVSAIRRLILTVGVSAVATMQFVHIWVGWAWMHEYSIMSRGAINYTDIFSGQIWNHQFFHGEGAKPAHKQ